MLKKVGSWIGAAKRYISNVQNEVSSIGDEAKNIYETTEEKTDQKKNLNEKKDV